MVFRPTCDLAMCQYPCLQMACLTPEHAEDEMPGTSWKMDSLTKNGRPVPLTMLRARSNCERL